MNADDTMTEINECKYDNEIDELLRKSTQYNDFSLELPKYNNITILDLGNGSLSSLPTQMPLLLPNIKILFLSNNKFIEMPSIISKFTQLEMVAFKGNQMRSIHPDCFPPNHTTKLRWIILTNNCITEIPNTIGHCTKLQKFMLSGNCLTSIPSTISNCTELELVRLACNQLLEPPMELLQLPKLKWIALGGNTFLDSVAKQQPTGISIHTNIPIFYDIDETSGTVLGRGASGITRAIEIPTSTVFSHHHHHPNSEEHHESMTVAVKSYHGDMTSDGTPELERKIALLVSQIQQQQQQLSSMSDTTIETNMVPSETSKTGFIHVYGQCDKTGSLVMEYLHNYRTIADPPSFDSCTRDVYDHPTNTDNKKWSPNDVIRFINVTLYSLQLLHSHGISHGDFYGHNILISHGNNNSDADDCNYASINVRLSDFGAAFMYDTNSNYGKYIEKIEIRAFQVLLEELIEHYYDDQKCVDDDNDKMLTNLLNQCNVASTFSDIYIYWQQQQLKNIAKAFGADDV